MAPTRLVKTNRPSKMKMVKSTRPSILLELSLIPKFIARTTKLQPKEETKLTKKELLTHMPILMVSTMPKMDMLSSSKVARSAV